MNTNSPFLRYLQYILRHGVWDRLFGWFKYHTKAQGWFPGFLFFILLTPFKYQAMNPLDLRIGNFICWDDDSHEIIRVESITKGKEEIDGMYFVNGGWIEDFLPIPITEEWLLKFGFERQGKEFKHPNKYFYLYVSISALSNIEVKLDYCYSRESEPEIIDHIKTVHQLQNLYMSLTGEELTFKIS